MNFQERRNLLFRFIAVGSILLSIGLDIFTLIKVFEFNAEDKVLSIIAVIFVIVFSIFEIIVIMLGWKKDSNLYKIAFNTNGRVNNVPMVAVIVGSGFGLGLEILALVVYLTRSEISTKNAMIIILAIASYLLVNCAIYFIYLLIFKKRELRIKDLIK